MNKCAVVFYTWGGQTKAMAQKISELTGADMIEIKPEKPYSQDYGTCVKEAKKEFDEKKLPELTEQSFDMSGYDTIYVGGPIWFGTVAAPVAAFLKQTDLSGKTVMPFVTHGGGGKANTDKDIAVLCHGADIKPALSVYKGGEVSDIENWIAK